LDAFGAADPNERPAEAAVRGYLEATGLLVEITGLTGVLGGSDFLVQYPNGDTRSRRQRPS
jgi:hypothetical protein